MSSLACGTRSRPSRNGHATVTRKLAMLGDPAPTVVTLVMLPLCEKCTTQAKTQLSSAHLTDTVNFLYIVNSIHKRTNGDSPG